MTDIFFIFWTLWNHRSTVNDALHRDLRQVFARGLACSEGAVWCDDGVNASAQVSGGLQPQPSLPRGFTGAHCQVHLNPNASAALAAAYSDSPLKRNRPPPLNQRAIFEVPMLQTTSPPSPVQLVATAFSMAAAARSYVDRSSYISDPFPDN
jgi:hypothetical protein